MSRIDDIRAHALSFEGAWEDHPWGDAVYKTAKGKIFLFASEDDQGRLAMTVKLGPDEGQAALTLRFVSQAAYVGRFGWITARIRDEAEYEIAFPWVARSFELISPKPRRRRE
jgi:predicted DNA-binding protein (MmcQ/YjbR family)